MRNFKSGKFINQGYYKSFQPEFVNRIWEIYDMELIQLMSTADRSLGRLDMYSEYVNIDLYIQMHIAKEATQSSKIEGTQTNIEETFLTKQEIKTEDRNDWEEVQNYITAMKEAVDMLHKLPFSSRLIRETHKILLKGVRGERKMPGEFRTSQNWIGGANINEATFVPPVFNEVPALVSDLEKFANNSQIQLPDLVKTAIIHYQFETIHPFLDGNGRVGRLLITLFLVSAGILKRPILYLSDFFERNRMQYYDHLMKARTDHALGQWIKFFLTGVIETSQKGVRTFDDILQLQKSLEFRLKNLGPRVSDAHKIIEQLYQKPVMNAKEISQITGKTLASTYKLIDELEKRQILKEITGNERDRIFVFEDYIALFRN